MLIDEAIAEVFHQRANKGNYNMLYVRICFNKGQQGQIYRIITLFVVERKKNKYMCWDYNESSFEAYLIMLISKQYPETRFF